MYNPADKKPKSVWSFNVTGIDVLSPAPLDCCDMLDLSYLGATRSCLIAQTVANFMLLYP